jgi:hypothetical protein
MYFWTCRSLKVVGNEKVGESRRWHMIDIGLGLWFLFLFGRHLGFNSISISAHSSPIISH